jgi:hypothetical protein
MLLSYYAAKAWFFLYVARLSKQSESFLYAARLSKSRVNPFYMRHAYPSRVNPEWGARASWNEKTAE